MNKQNIVVDFEDLKSTYKSNKYYNLAILKYGYLLPVYSSPALARIVAGILTDGTMDIRRRYNSLYYGYVGLYSKDKKELSDFGNVVFKQFKIKGKVRNWGTKTFGESYGYIIINSFFTRILSLCGVPAGDKVKNKYCLPNWIINSNKHIKSSFLQALFVYEGSITS